MQMQEIPPDLQGFTANNGNWEADAREDEGEEDEDGISFGELLKRKKEREMRKVDEREYYESNKDNDKD